MSLNLVNVSVEMIPKFSFGKVTSIENAPCFLGRLDFVQSRFMYESFSDGSKSIDLVSHGVLLHDIRGKGRYPFLLLILLNICVFVASSPLRFTTLSKRFLENTM